MPRRSKRKKSTAAKPRRKTSVARRRGRRAVAGWLLLSLLVLFLVYLGYLNFLLGSRFEGDTWALPSRVYARALEMYPGLSLARTQLEYELRLSSYLQVDDEPLPGQYRRLGASIELHSRPFDFADGPQPPRRLQVFFDDDRIDALIDSVDGDEIRLFRLPPVIIGSYYPDNGEDRRFYQHRGVSPKAILRALLANLEAGKTVQGGSTLTQQLAKNMFLSSERSLLRKISEALMALLLELRFDKKTILTAYVNEVFLLQQNRVAIHGFARASRMLFRRSVDHLEAQHLALLVGMIQGPSRYNPFRFPESARERRDLVLRIMLQQGVLEEQAYAAAVAAPLGIVERLPGVNPFPAYLDLVKRQLPSVYSGDDLRRRGLRVFTAFDPQLQRSLELGLAAGLARFAQPELQAAVVVADYLSGDVLALASDRQTDFPGFNRALMAQRPIGSLIKPMLLYSLLQDGLTLASPVRDEPIRIRQSDGKIWEPRNFDRELHGAMTLYQAFVNSYNLPFVGLGVDGGLETLADNLARIRLLKHEVVYPSILLGTSAMSAYEVAQMYQVIANNGYFTPLTTLRGVSDQAHRSLERVPLESHKLFDQARMIQVQRAMIGVAESGTADYLAERFPGRSLAGKTGTTNDARDSWFAGFSRRLLGVVWLGRDDNLPIGLSGSSGALRVWADIMTRVDFEAFKLTQDSSLEWRTIDPLTGGSVKPSCENGVLLPFPQGRAPVDRSRCR